MNGRGVGFSVEDEDYERLFAISFALVVQFPNDY